MPKIFISIFTFTLLLFNVSNVNAKLTLKEVRTASNDVLVVFFTSDKIDVNEADIKDVSEWSINGQPAKSINKYVVQADQCDHHIYLQTDQLVKGKEYSIKTPYGNTKFTFDPKNILCDSIKVNQAGYSARSKSRYANFAIWLGTGGNRKISGVLPGFRSAQGPRHPPCLQLACCGPRDRRDLHRAGWCAAPTRSR